jgi:tetratricopeptide (TPR) repeat protein
MWGGFWNRPWFAPAALWGVGAWGLGPVVYDSGIVVYNNPYVVNDASYYDYSQPLQVAAQLPEAASGNENAAAPEPPAEDLASRPHLDAASDAFYAGDYAKAGSELELAIKANPRDAALHEFRALVYFATGDYTKAAGTLYAVLSAGPGWDWTTMSSLYPDVDVYTKQYRALEEFVKSHPGEADGRFVLAYHYITGSHEEAAGRQLKEVLRIHPDDQLVAQLIHSLGGEEVQVADAAGALPESTAIEQPVPPDIDPARIVGRWRAKRADGTTFTLDLTPDKKFTWRFERGSKSNEFGGTYTVDGAVLVLERTDKSTMPGLVTLRDKGFGFQLFGAPTGDQGLEFKK